MSRIALVTGGAGFIGSSICRGLLRRGDRVRVIDNFSSGRRQNLAEIAGDIEVIEGDILDPDKVAEAARGCEVIFHQAAIPSVPRSLTAPLASHQTNTTGTLTVLEAARALGVRRVIYAGSSSAYGDTPVLPKVEPMPTMPLSPYAVAKLTGELYCQMYARTLGVETVILRYFNVFGPRQDPTSQYAAVIPRFVTSALEGRSPQVFGDGTQSRDFCFIDNVVDANLRAAEARDVSGSIFNVACGQSIDLNSVLSLCSQLTGKPVSAIYQPARTGDVKHSLADIGAARRQLGYEPKVLFAEGLARVVDWFKAGAPS